MIRKKITPDISTMMEKIRPGSEENVISPKPSVDMTVSVQ